MGFWGTLGKLGSIAGAGIATGMTGGAAAPLLGTALSMGGEVMSGIANSRAKGREQAASTNMDRDRLTMQGERDYQDALMDRANLDLKQRSMARDARGIDARDAMRGALMKNMQDVSMARPAGIPVMQFAGGARPSALGAEGRQAGELLNQQALASLMAGEKFNALPELQRTKLSELPKANFWDKLLNIGSGVGLGASVLNKAMPRPATAPRLMPPMASGVPAGLPGAVDMRNVRV